jgi:small ubiquitin-related modifier
MQPSQDEGQSRPRTRALGATLPAGVRVVHLDNLRERPTCQWTQDGIVVDAGAVDADAVAALRESLCASGAVVLSLPAWHACQLRRLSDATRETLSGAAHVASAAAPADGTPLPPCIRQLPGDKLLLEYRWGDELAGVSRLAPSASRLEGSAYEAYMSLSDAGRVMLAALSDTRVARGRVAVAGGRGTRGALPRLMEAELLEPHERGCSRLSLFRYPRGVGAPQHTDSGLLTLIVCAGDGLQIHTRVGGWQTLRCAPGQVAVLAGETLAHATRGAVAPSLHRVDAERRRSRDGRRARGGSGARTSVVLRLRGAPDARLPRGVGAYADATTVAAFERAFRATHGSINAARGPDTHVDLSAAAVHGVAAAPSAAGAQLQLQPAAEAGESAAEVVLRMPHLLDALVALLAEDGTGRALARGELLCASLRRAIAPRWHSLCVARLGAAAVPPRSLTAPDDAAPWRRLHRHATRQVTVRVKGQDGTEVHFLITRTTRFRDVFHAYCAPEELELSSVRFLFDGQRMDPSATMHDLCMWDHECIDAMLEQVGD